MRAILLKAGSDLRRRKLQTAVVAFIVLLASGAGTMALSLLLETDAPFEHAFNNQVGAHLAAVFDPGSVGIAQLQATGHLTTVASAAGPWRQVEVMLQRGDGLSSVTLIGRDGPGGAVDRLTMVAGRWAKASGEVVFERHLADEQGIQVGNTFSAIDAPGKPHLTVVGVAISLGRAEGWVLPSGVDSLVPAATTNAPGGSDKSGPGSALGAPTQYLMEYRLYRATQPADIEAAARQIAAAVPAGALLGTGSWLDIKAGADTLNNVMVPFLLAFSVVALIASALVIANVVTGVVIADYREIGIMKSIGFSPSQVVAVLALETLSPALLGCLLGLPLGRLASWPFLQDAAHAFGVPPPPDWSPGIVAVVGAIVLIGAALSAVIPALRAASLSTSRAIAVGSAPQSTRANPLVALVAKLSLPTPIGLGIAGSFVRPVRATITVVAILFGVATVTFGAALHGSLGMVKDATTRSDAVQVEVVSGPASSNFDPNQVMSVLVARPEATNVVPTLRFQVKASGITAPVFLEGFQGRSSGLGFALIRGSWFNGSDQVVAPSGFLDATHASIGDLVRISNGPTSRPMRIVGTYVTNGGGGFLLLTDWATLLGVDPGARPDTWEVQLRSGSDVLAYADATSNQLTPLGLTAEPVAGRGTDQSFVLLNLVIISLVLVLTLIAVAGVFNTVLLDTREKMPEFAVLKAIGMTPRQAVTTVLTTVIVFGVAGALLGIPLGLVMHHQILGQVATIAGTDLPSSFYNPLGVLVLPLLGGTGVLVAVGGAILPATWIARTRVAAVLRSE